MRNGFFWSTLPEDVATFVRSCIHCMSTTSGNRVPRPFCLLYMGQKLTTTVVQLFRNGVELLVAKYLLVLRDDFSSFCWLFPYQTLRMLQKQY